MTTNWGLRHRRSLSWLTRHARRGGGGGRAGARTCDRTGAQTLRAVAPQPTACPAHAATTGRVGPRRLRPNKPSTSSSANAPTRPHSPKPAEENHLTFTKGRSTTTNQANPVATQKCERQHTRRRRTHLPRRIRIQALAPRIAAGPGRQQLAQAARLTARSTHSNGEKSQTKLSANAEPPRTAKLAHTCGAQHAPQLSQPVPQRIVRPVRAHARQRIVRVPLHT